MPRRKISVPMVKTSELMPRRPISVPWMAPSAAPASVAISTAPTRPAPSHRTAITAATAAIEPTDRSNSPAMMVAARPSATRPTSEKPSSTEKMLAAPRKVGVMLAMTSHVTASTKAGRKYGRRVVRMPGFIGGRLPGA